LGLQVVHFKDPGWALTCQGRENADRGNCVFPGNGSRSVDVSQHQAYRCVGYGYGLFFRPCTDRRESHWLGYSRDPPAMRKSKFRNWAPVADKQAQEDRHCV